MCTFTRTPSDSSGLGRTPLVMSEGSSSAVYLGDYLGWDSSRLGAGLRADAADLPGAPGFDDRLLAMESVARVYVFSDWAREVNLRWGADPAKLEVVAAGIPDAAVGRPCADAATFSFLFLGTDFERKGGFDVVEAFDRIAGDHPSARLVLVGSNPWEQNPDRRHHSWVSDSRRATVLTTLERLERAGIARHESFVTAERVQRSLYPTADVFVMPTLGRRLRLHQCRGNVPWTPNHFLPGRSNRGDG